ncbi:MAG: alpha/beta hydrolase [Myxococcales bacterium]|nr:alpha/beta hydrolase [Myxococcales bacterium]
MFPPASEQLQRALANQIQRLPRGVLARLAGPPARAPEGYPMDAEVQFLFRLGRLVGQMPSHSYPVEVARRRFEVTLRLATGPYRRGLHVWDQQLTGDASHLRVRVYRPASRPAGNAATVFFHGGGFVLGSLDSHDDLCRTIALDADCVVVAVQYRLAPEAPFPAAYDDAVAAFRAVAASAASFGARADRLAVAGDSAGGNLAAEVALATRHDALRPRAQWLIYPATDFTRSAPSHAMFLDLDVLSKATLDWFLDAYVPDPAMRRDARCSPLFIEDLGGLPPAVVQGAGFDPLRDEAQRYAEAMRAAGVGVEFRCEEGLPHGWASMLGPSSSARSAVQWGVSRLAAALHR